MFCCFTYRAHQGHPKASGSNFTIRIDQDADNYCEGELLGPQCPGTSSTYHRLSLLSPPQGLGLPPVSTRRGREQLRPSPPGVPAGPTACTAHRARPYAPSAAPSCPSLHSPRASKPGLPSVCWLSFLLNAFSQSEIFTITMRSSMITRMLLLRCECPLPREGKCSSFVF